MENYFRNIKPANPRNKNKTPKTTKHATALIIPEQIIKILILNLLLSCELIVPSGIAFRDQQLIVLILIIGQIYFSKAGRIYGSAWEGTQ